MTTASGTMRNLLNIMESLGEARDPNLEYKEEKNKVIVFLSGHQSAKYTNLGKKLQRIDQLKEELERLNNEVKDQTKEDIAGLFDATDAATTRVVDTVSFIFTLSKDPEAGTTTKYEKVLTELTKHLTPKLLTVLETIKAAHTSASAARSPSLSKKEKVTEDESNPYDRLNMVVQQWAQSYDQELQHLKQMV